MPLGVCMHARPDPCPPPPLQVYDVLDQRGGPVEVRPGSMGVAEGTVELVFGGKGGPDLKQVRVGSKCYSCYAPTTAALAPCRATAQV
jgi:hypothetical protein